MAPELLEFETFMRQTLRTWARAMRELSALILAVATTAVGPTTFAQSTTPAAPDVPEAECELFGHQLERHFAAGDKGFYARAFDGDGLFERLAAGHGGVT